MMPFGLGLGAVALLRPVKLPQKMLRLHNFQLFLTGSFVFLKRSFLTQAWINLAFRIGMFFIYILD